MSKYELWFPFRLPEWQSLGDLKEPITGTVLGLQADIRKAGHLTVLVARGLESMDSADAAMKKIAVGLWFCAVELRMGLEFNPTLQEVTYAEDPEKAAENLSKMFGWIDGPVHGLCDASQPFAYPEDRNIIKLTVPPIKASGGTNPSLFFDGVNEGASLRRAEAVLGDPKLKLGLELYSAAHFQEDAAARYVALWTALEVLAPRPDRSHETKKIRRIVRYVQETLREEGASKDRMTDLEREVQELYGLRCKLVHEGVWEQKDGVGRLEIVLRDTLRAAVRQCASRPRS